MKRGIAKTIVKMVPATFKLVVNIILTFIGIWLSTTSISLENRFKILPRGVVSKKDIGERRMRISMVLCSSEAAFRVKTCILCLHSNSEWFCAAVRQRSG